MSRPLKNMTCFRFNLDKQLLLMIQEIAELETISYGHRVTVTELMRNALKWVYGDNERLRECFRRSRASSKWIEQKKIDKMSKKKIG